MLVGIPRHDLVVLVVDEALVLDRRGVSRRDTVPNYVINIIKALLLLFSIEFRG